MGLYQCSIQLELNNKFKNSMFFNYIHPNLEIKMTKNKGRGVFATWDIKKESIIIIERPIVSVDKLYPVPPKDES